MQSWRQPLFSGCSSNEPASTSEVGKWYGYNTDGEGNYDKGGEFSALFSWP
ncbi:MAG: hypothetical protein K6F58_00795 [Bacteroidales bacterium]|nr:hypothetical protein [Bacteroidales bacterium]